MSKQPEDEMDELAREIEFADHVDEYDKGFDFKCHGCHETMLHVPEELKAEITIAGAERELISKGARKGPCGCSPYLQWFCRTCCVEKLQ